MNTRTIISLSVDEMNAIITGYIEKQIGLKIEPTSFEYKISRRLPSSFGDFVPADWVCTGCHVSTRE